MNSLVAVEAEAAGQRGLRLPHARVVLQVHLLVLHAPPEPLDEHVVDRPAPAIHADRHTARLQPLSERPK